MGVGRGSQGDIEERAYGIDVPSMVDVTRLQLDFYDLSSLDTQ